LARQETSLEPDINQQLRKLLTAPTVEEEDDVLNRDTRAVVLHTAPRSRRPRETHGTQTLKTGIPRESRTDKRKVTLTKTSDNKRLKSSKSPECVRTVTYVSPPVTTQESEDTTASENFIAITTCLPEDPQPLDEMTIVFRSKDLAVEEKLENARPRPNIWRCNDEEYYEFTEAAPSAAQDVTMQNLDVPEEAWTCEMPSTSNAEDPRCPVKETDVVQLFFENIKGPTSSDTT
jgi:hypothetical protein